MSNPNNTWKFKPYKRWKISAQLRTASPLHIGSGETTTDPRLFKVDINDQGIKEKKAIEINASIRNGKNKPYLPGTTLKGNLLAWLDARIQNEQQRQDLRDIFGQTSLENMPVVGGRAEFHDAPLTSELPTDGKNYPYWRKESQTYIETSIAINRITRTVADGKLFYTELVPPDVGFEAVITGVMTDSQADLIIAVLQAFGNPEQGATLGAENASGKGRMRLYGNVEAASMDAQQASDWLSQGIGMAETALLPLSKEEVDARAKPVTDSLAKTGQRDSLQLTIQMDGPFLINNPEAALQDDAETDHQPLLDAQGKPLLSGKSLRGAMRSQAERIVRSLGGTCCDTARPCEPIFRKQDLEELCLACQVFGAAGWQSPLHIHHFKFTGKTTAPTEKQEFVAIDRFHGGGKHGAKYNATSYLRPEFTGVIELDRRLPDWGKGLLALLLRDFKEGDIKLGFAANKGYGGVEKLTVTPDLFTENDLNAFREKCREASPAQTVPDAFVMPSRIEQTATLGEAANGGVTPPLPAGEGRGEGDQRNAFYNPYQFVPVKAPDKQAHWLDKQVFVEGKHHHSHAVYRNRTDEGAVLYHGRLYCKLEAETAFFIGAKRLESNTVPAQVDNYRLNNELAIPATSLRGMISSLAEAASNSAMRVLDNGLLSYHKPMSSKPLSAIGMVIKQGKDFKLIPLALPTLDKKEEGFQQPVEFNKMFPDGRAALKVYLNDAYGNDEMAEFLTDKNTWTPENSSQIFYLDLDPLHLKMVSGKLLNNAGEELLRRPSKNSEKYIIGQNSIPVNSRPIPAHELSEQKKASLTPGILRILGKTHRDLPKDKKHELFIPVPPKFAGNFEQFIKEAPAFPISSEAIERFEELADQCTDSQKQERIEHDEQWLPYHLKGTTRTDKHKLKLKHGDLVYFRPDETDHKTVAEIAFSALWRGRVENNKRQAATVFAFLPKDLLPFRKGRDSLSPAELLFGFVEDQKNLSEADKQKALAFAGKVRISVGRLINADNKSNEAFLGAPVPLKILSSPKLPSPALYFREKVNVENRTKNTCATAYVPKNTLCPEKHQAKGRKHYLHALRSDASATVQKLSSNGMPSNNEDALFPWETRDAKENTDQKVTITPIRPKTQFTFHVDFDNLTEWELGLLCYALKPSETYRHKLGMGKPIGLGSVNIAIDKMELIDRYQRYAKDGLNTKRYNGIENVFSIDALRKQFVATMDGDIRQALELLGNPHNVVAPVHYPQIQREDIEKETYRWFVANDSCKDATKKQSLPLLDGNTEKLPPLAR